MSDVCRVLVEYALIGGAPGDAARERALAWLTAEERARYERFIPEHSKIEFLAARRLARRMIGEAIGAAPREIRFEIGEHGKPALAGALRGKIEFNLTHTRGLVACAVSRAGMIGVDAEEIDLARATESIARRYFSETEVEDLSRFRGEAHARRFFRIWTLKEAYIKALGLGMALPLKQFYFRLSEPAGGKAAGDEGAEPVVRIGFAPGYADDPARWKFAMAAPTERHFLSVAADRGGRADFRIEIREADDLWEDV